MHRNGYKTSAFTVHLGRTTGFTRPLFGGPQVFFNPPDTGGGGDGGGDGAGGAGGGTNDGGGDGGGEFQGLTFKEGEDPMVRFPGMAKPVKWSEYQKQFVPRADHDRLNNFIGELGKRLKAGGQGGQGQRRDGGQGHGQGQQPPKRRASDRTPDPLAAFEELEVPNGREVAGLLRQMESTRLAPIVKVVEAMAKKLQNMEQGLGRVSSRYDQTDFDGNVQGAVKALALPDFEGADVLQELARDIFYSYTDEDQAKLQGAEFHKLVKGRFEQLDKAFQALGKARLEAERARLKGQRFARKGAPTGANGKPKVMTNREAAAALFAADRIH